MNQTAKVAARLTWKSTLAVLLAGMFLAWDKWQRLHAQQVPVSNSWAVWYFIAYETGAILLLAAALHGDAAIERGARPLRVYPLLLLAAFLVSILTATAIVSLGAHYQRPWWDGLARPFVAVVGASVDFANDFIVSGGLPLLLYANRQTANRILRRVQALESQRIRRERQLVDSRLAAAEAQMDPTMLLAALAAIKSDFEGSIPEADEKLESLIKRLRLSLSRTMVANESEEAPP